jgi:hypothetical protein
MRSRPAAVCAMALALVGCDAGERGCVTDAELWLASSGPTCVQGDVTVEGRTLDELVVLERIEEISGSLRIYHNPGLTELPELPALVRLGGTLTITENPALERVRGFPSLSEAAGIYIAENPELRRVVLSDALLELDSLFIAVHPALEEFIGLSQLERVRHGVVLSANGLLPSFAFPALAEIGGDLLLSDNEALQSAEFSALRTVGGSWTLARNPALVDLAGFAALESALRTFIVDNDALTAISLTNAFSTVELNIVDNDRLEVIEADASIVLYERSSCVFAHNDALRELAGFASVTSLGTLWIESNPSLREIQSFAALQRVDPTDLRIYRNERLEGPESWFPALRQAGNVWLIENPALPASAVDAFFLGLNVEGEIRVGDNGGKDTALDPCPWPEDGICDAALTPSSHGTALCAEDPADCD